MRIIWYLERRKIMTYTEKYQLALKPYLKYTDCLHLIGTNTKGFTKKYFQDMVATLQKQNNMVFGPWGIPNKLVLNYIGLDVELLKLNAENEKNRPCA